MTDIKFMKKAMVCTLVCMFLVACQAIGQQNTRTTVYRSTGTVVDDKSAVWKINRELRKSGLTSGNHINTTVFNGIALLTGEVSTHAQKQKADKVANRLQHVRMIFNQLAIASPSSFSTRFKDSATTGLVKTALLRHPDVHGSRIKVVTERGIVYLLGLVPASEADTATSTTRRVRGVKKVVRLFEIVK